MDKLFDNTQVAFSLKSDNELNRAYFLFKMIANQPLVRIGTAMTNFALKAHLPVERIIRATVFDHFCGGVSEDDCISVMEKMFQKSVSSVLDYSVEGKEDEAHFDEAMNKILKIINFSEAKPEMPFIVFKPTGFGRFELYQKIGENQILTDDEQQEWGRVEARYDLVCSTAHKKGVAILIDGEESWMQDAADVLATSMMRKYNKKSAVVFNTLQLYRWDRLDYLKKLHEQAKSEGFFIGMKLVRGAYMEKENSRAIDLVYESPICKTKEATDQNFDDAVIYMTKNLESMAIFAGTHNENSCYKLLDLQQKLGIDKKDFRIWYGQLYGMSDNISFNLAEKGFNVAKYLPFGPVRDVMPYLIRRAEENTSVAGQTNRELNLLNTERIRRKK